MRIILASRKDYAVSKKVYKKVKCIFPETVFAGDREALEKVLEGGRPDYIFFLFWSWLIPADIIRAYNCISFHTGDLPKDRGGSPIQNQIIAGGKESMLTAFKTSERMDEGDIYLKEPLSLEGGLQDIFGRIGKLAPGMIERIISEGIAPKPQKGEPSYFKRRTPEQSEIKPAEMTAEEIYNLVRALDMEPYPHAFIRGKNGKRVFILKAMVEEEAKK